MTSPANFRGRGTSDGFSLLGLRSSLQGCRSEAHGVKAARLFCVQSVNSGSFLARRLRLLRFDSDVCKKGGRQPKRQGRGVFVAFQRKEAAIGVKAPYLGFVSQRWRPRSIKCRPAIAGFTRSSSTAIAFSFISITTPPRSLPAAAMTGPDASKKLPTMPNAGSAITDGEGGGARRRRHH